MMITIIYDGDCPLCTRYITRRRLIEVYGEVHLVNARDNSDLTKSYWALGYDLDEGMIVAVSDQIYYGPEAVMVLARLSARPTLWDRLCLRLFTRTTIANTLYAVMKAARSLALRLRGRTRISEPPR
jgi:predicted DCC family thiol-disulfide oxidoreductase YuxK